VPRSPVTAQFGTLAHPFGSFVLSLRGKQCRAALMESC
jgi:hypothetical protein